jgi:hypothetical protein
MTVAKIATAASTAIITISFLFFILEVMRCGGAGFGAVQLLSARCTTAAASLAARKQD